MKKRNKKLQVTEELKNELRKNFPPPERPSHKSPIWQTNVSVRPAGIVRAGNTIFIAGSPDVVDPKDPHGAWEGRKGGVLLAFSAADGRKLSEYKLPAPPVWDGLAAAGGRLYIGLMDGSVVCWKAKK